VAPDRRHTGAGFRDSHILSRRYEITLSARFRPGDALSARTGRFWNVSSGPAIQHAVEVAIHWADRASIPVWRKTWRALVGQIYGYNKHKDRAVNNIEGLDNDWRQHWFDMPEFEQKKIEPFSTVIVRVETEDDLIKLQHLLGQKLTSKTKSIWFPYRPHRLSDKKVWRNG
jgi:hypothetical protein